MYRLLIVEDESWIRMGLESAFDWKAVFGVQLLPSASNGEEALTRMAECVPDIVLTDIRMPQMNGLELIRTIRARYPLVMVMIISGFAEFEYAQMAIRYGAFCYVLKPIEEDALAGEITNCLEAIRERERQQEAQRLGQILRRERIAHSWLTGQASAAKAETLRPTGRDARGECSVRVALLRILWKREPEEDASLRCQLYDSLRAYVRDMLDGMLIVPVDMGGEIALVLDDNFGSTLDRCLEALNITGQSELGFSVALGISERNAFGLDGSAMYQEAARRLNEGLRPESPHPVPENREAAEALRVFSQRMRSRDVAAAISEIEAYFGAQTARMRPRVENDGVAIAFLMSAYRALDQKDSLKNARAVPAVAERICLAGDAWQMKNCLIGAILEWFPGGAPCRTLVAAALDYIEAHLYEEDLSLNVVSSKLHTNNAYLSHAFKEDLGENILEYIMRRRIEEACQLLKGPGISICDVAEKVGYPNVQYFNRIFKKISGTTPGQYRRNGNKQKSCS
jgi:two-component system response regulator YesN